MIAEPRQQRAFEASPVDAALELKIHTREFAELPETPLGCRDIHDGNALTGPGSNETACHSKLHDRRSVAQRYVRPSRRVQPLLGRRR